MKIYLIDLACETAKQFEEEKCFLSAYKTLTKMIGIREQEKCYEKKDQYNVSLKTPVDKWHRLRKR